MPLELTALVHPICNLKLLSEAKEIVNAHRKQMEMMIYNVRNGMEASLEDFQEKDFGLDFGLVVCPLGAFRPIQTP